MMVRSEDYAHWETADTIDMLVDVANLQLWAVIVLVKEQEKHAEAAIAVRSSC